MKPFPRGLALALSLVCAGACGVGGGGGGGGGGPSPLCIGGAGGAGGTRRDGPMLLPLDQVPLSLELGVSSPQCAGPVPTVKTEVFDPTNLPVEHSSTGVMAGLATTITFTPLKPGSYHLSATFEPSLGSAQLDVMVAHNRQTASGFDAPKVTEFAAGCVVRERLSDGAQLCSDPQRLRVVSATGTLSLRPADNHARVGDVVWVLNSGSVARYRLASGFTAEPTDPLLLSTPGLGLGASLTATAEQLWVVDSTGVSRVVFANGQLTAQRAAWATPLGVYTVLSTLSANGAVLGAAGPNAYCQISAASLGASSCQPLSGQTPVGAEAAALWFTQGTVLKRVTPAESVDGFPQSTSLVLPALMKAEGFSGLAPIAQGCVPRVFPPTDTSVSYVPRFEAEQGIVLEQYFSSTPERMVFATSTQVGFERTDGSFRYVTR